MTHIFQLSYYVGNKGKKYIPETILHVSMMKYFTSVNSKKKGLL